MRAFHVVRTILMLCLMLVSAGIKNPYLPIFVISVYVAVRIKGSFSQAEPFIDKILKVEMKEFLNVVVRLICF